LWLWGWKLEAADLVKNLRGEAGTSAGERSLTILNGFSVSAGVTVSPCGLLGLASDSRSSCDLC
jgi:hypothetical protein